MTLIKVSDETATALAWAIYDLSIECALRSDMALELKGLKAKAIKARSSIDALNTAYDKFNEAAPAHAADVASLTDQLSGMQEDLQFAVTTLGNSVGEQEKPPEETKGTVKPDEAVAIPEQPTVAPAAFAELPPVHPAFTGNMLAHSQSR